MKLIVIFGPPAVGKMTVGYELKKLTDYKLFHNHMVIELVHNFFGWDDVQFWPMVRDFRKRIFNDLKNSSTQGIIFTYMWALNVEDDYQELSGYIAELGISEEDVLYVELFSDLNERLLRNKSEFRLNEKKTKRNICESEKYLIECGKQYKLNSDNDFLFPERHIKIDNTNISPEEVALIIVREMGKIESGLTSASPVSNLSIC